jgi:hypothetical protein
MPRWRWWLIGMLVLAVAIAAGYFPVLKRNLRLSAQAPAKSEEQVRRELTQPAAANAGEPVGKAKLFWSSGARDGSLMAVTVDLPLPRDPVLRAKQVLNTLLAGPVDAELRTLPPDAVLLAFYLLPDGTGVADFSEALGTATPSGIESEEMAVDSITKTLEANVPQIRWLKILVHGQEMDTLAGTSGFNSDVPGKCSGSGIARAPSCRWRFIKACAFRGLWPCACQVACHGRQEISFPAKVDTCESPRQTGAH